MNQTTIIMLNMRGSCATDGKKVHALFRVNNRRSAAKAINDASQPAAAETCERAPRCESQLQSTS